jgi:RNA polymerase sigma-70 factor (ECF subfamily)
MKIPDEKLVEAYLKGDKRALEILIKRYLKAIYNFAYRYVGKEEAEDVTQEVFLKMWRNLKKFKKEKNFKSWLWTIARNACFDFLRKKRRSQVWYLEDLSSLPDSRSLPYEALEKEGLKEKLEEAIKSLPFKMRQILNLYYKEGLNFREIAETLNESLNTIKSRHRRALKEIKKLLSEEDF